MSILKNMGILATKQLKIEHLLKCLLAWIHKNKGPNIQRTTHCATYPNPKTGQKIWAQN